MVGKVNGKKEKERKRMKKVKEEEKKEEEIIEKEMIMREYEKGIFKMEEEEEDKEVLWVSNEKRGVIKIEGLKIKRRIKKKISKGIFEIRIERNFEGVIEGWERGKGERERKWIKEKIRREYEKMLEIGNCKKVEEWYEGKMEGGIYGVKMGREFLGERMLKRKREE